MVTGCKLSKDDESLELHHSMYRSIIDSLLYVTTTRQYVMQGVGLVARFQSAPKETHVAVVKRILKYLKVTMDCGLLYPKGNNFTLKVVVDADRVGSINDRKSTSGAAFYLGDCLVSWLSKK